MPVNPLMQYDKGIYKMVHDLYSETVYAPPEECFKVQAKRHKGKVVLPMIAIWRLADFNLNLEMYNDLLTRQGILGRTRGEAEFPNQRVAAHMLPVTLQYQIDVYATRRDVCDGIVSELLIEFKERPHFKAYIQDMGDKSVKVEYDFLIDESVVDNTSITDFEEAGRIYRLTLTGNVPSAVIYRIDTFDKIDKVEVDVNVVKSFIDIDDETIIDFDDEDNTETNN